MNNSYYQLPFDFGRFFEKKALGKMRLSDSISQFISILITTYFKEYTFDEQFGSQIWETDFDLLTNPNILKEQIKESLQEKVSTYEKRLSNVKVQLQLGEDLSQRVEKVRLKKYLTIVVNGKIIKTDEPYHFTGHYFLAPLSYSG